jgi:hypothetical protein
MSAASLQGRPAGTDGTVPRLADHLTGRREDELVDLLGFALHARAHAAGDPEQTPQTCRTAATAMFHDAAYRYLHNRVAEIRSEALSEHAARTRRPPGLGKLVLANILALLIVGGAALALSGHGADAVAAARTALSRTGW